MLMLIANEENIKARRVNFNTSHVNVNHSVNHTIKHHKAYFNTSHVNVNPAHQT